MHVAMVWGLIALGSLSWCAGVLSVGPVVRTHSWPADTCMSFSSACGYLRAAYSSLLHSERVEDPESSPLLSPSSSSSSPPFVDQREKEKEKEKEKERQREW